ncbi:UDP-galactose transporter [Colletotrichum sublineola]|uniref:Putative UDP-galactose transporter n=1 Tax=Colletotrichum sublineola TaxID=1173701 RepID=A0A066XB45_COLSU|nr:UDP-galactose transporter [Colletotrichum sublineola]KDN63195.1 putative UDP-galactose transporter [Colletotrichum sublineola]
MLRHGSVLGFFLKPLGWIPGGPQQAAYAAALGLVAIQVGIGIIMKISQTGGSYSFSPSASVTISEFCKMVLSTIFFWNECKRRAADGVLPSTRGGGSGYSSLATSELPLAERSSLDEKREEEALNGSASSSSNADGLDKHNGPLPPLNFRTYWSYVRGEVTKDVRYGFCNLALFYVLINNSIFVSYKMADPGTIQLTKSGVTFITALVMIATLNTKISKIQWIAIVMQICGLMVTQYNPQTGTTYPFSTYFILLFQVFLSASSGVYNQALLKTDDSSLHADNMILYGAGASMNLLCHLVIRTLKADEPGFFEGYNSFGAIMVIVSNVFIGLAITAVYKYADAVIKCFATAVATGILLYVSPVLFGTKLSFLVLPGTVVVFVASWLYMDNPPPKDPNPPTNEHQNKSLFSKAAAVARKFNKIFLAVATFITVLIVAFLTMSEAKMPDFAKEGGSASKAASGPKPVTGIESKVESPFKNTMAMIRWNSAHPERIPMLQKYEPFFHTLHISMPNMFKGEDPEFHNLTHDQFPGTFTIYKQVSRTMKLILDTQPEIDGLMYYHFDAWVDPFGWIGMNPYNIHFPSVIDTAPPSHGGPEYMCLTDTANYNWWGWGQDFHRTAMAAASVVDNFGLEYKIRRDEFCVGWSDIYYIPRRFFADYIFLSEIFAGFGVFHEVAIPTMVHIIDQSRRRNPYRSIVDHISDCWGNCCSSNPKIRDVLGTRCGHRLNYLEEGPINAFYSKLDAQAGLIGQTLNSTKYAMASGDAAHLFDSAALAGINNGEAKKIAPVKDEALEDDQLADALAAEKVKQEKEKLKDEHAPVDKTGNLGDPKADPSKVPPPPPSGDHTPKPKDDKEKGVKEGGEKKDDKKVDPNDALREADRDANVKRRLRREIVAAVAGLGY